VLYPAELPLSPEPLVGAASVNRLFLDWRAALQGTPPAPIEDTAQTVGAEA
jgi:hypothetical protein